MLKLIEFIGNHPFLVMGFVATLGLLIHTEMTRAFSGVSSVSPFQATQMLNDTGARFVDVRTEAEFRGRHIKDSVNIVASAMSDRLNELEKFQSKELIVYCETGMRSARAARILKKNGFEKVYNLAGGVAAWEKASLPLVSK